MLNHLIPEFDQALKTLVPNSCTAMRPNPGDSVSGPRLSSQARHQVAQLMRVNHCGEVCAQALYRGQALVAKTPGTRQELLAAASEEVDHLVWCEQRLAQLNSRPSLLNPVFYLASFGLGLGAGLISDKLSLGFVAATEDQVGQHLAEHLASIGEQDPKSQAILRQMQQDEAEHAQHARQQGALEFPQPIKHLMTQASKLMTWTTARI